MEVFTVNHRRLIKYKFWSKFEIWIYILLLIGLLSPFILVPLLTDGSWNPKYEKLGKIAITVLVIGILFLIHLCIRLLVSFNNYIKKMTELCTDLVIEFNGTVFYLVMNNSKYTFPFDEITLNNFVFNVLRGPFAGQGILVITDSNNQKIIIPSVVFDVEMGGYKIRDLFKNRVNYRESKLYSKDIKNLLTLNKPIIKV